MRKNRVVLYIGAALILAAGGWLWWWSAKAADIESIERIVRRRYPRVRRLSTAALADWLKSNRPKPVLLDVRSSDEYAVSHLPGAHHVDPGSSIECLASIVSKDAPIVTYCAVGWRSSGYAMKLREAGYSNVQNLEGSIFRWANEDRPLVRDGEPADKIHPHSAFWGHLVKPDRRAGLSAGDR